MTSPPESPNQFSPPAATRRDWLLLGLVVVFFLILRIPVMLRQPGGMDEDWFAVPGWTVSREGIPRIPYAPEEHRTSYFWHADVMLFALPPAYHYWQAPFFLLFPAGYGTARLASCAAGLIAIWLVFDLTRLLLRDRQAALWGAGLFSLSRAFYFPATIARPDILCATLGLAAVWSLWHWQQTQRSTWLIGSGILLGLAGLTHPFAIVMAIQATGWLICLRPGWMQFFKQLGTLAGCALATFALWLLLIWQQPEIFTVQFFGNVLHRSTGSVPGKGVVRALWETLAYQGNLLLEYFGAWQLGLASFGIAWMLMQLTEEWKRRRTREKTDHPQANPGLSTLAGLTLSSIILLSLLQGKHPTKGYWVYPAAICFICIGGLVTNVCQSARNRGGLPLQMAIGAVSIGLFLPGLGLRTTAVYLREWNNPDYNGARFLRNVLTHYPASATYIVDPAYVFDVQVTGRKALLGVTEPIYFHAQDFPFDYYFAGRYGLENKIPEQLNGTPIAQYGNYDDPFACYLEVYQSRKSASHDD